MALRPSEVASLMPAPRQPLIIVQSRSGCRGSYIGRSYRHHSRDFISFIGRSCILALGFSMRAMHDLRMNTVTTFTFALDNLAAMWRRVGGCIRHTTLRLPGNDFQMKILPVFDFQTPCKSTQTVYSNPTFCCRKKEYISSAVQPT